jgi:hypothetical protein
MDLESMVEDNRTAAIDAITASCSARRLVLAIFSPEPVKNLGEVF